MSAQPATLLGLENVTVSGAIILPNRLSFEDLLHLEKHLAGRTLVFLLESASIVDPLLQAHLEKDTTTALVFSLADDKIEDLKKALHAHISRDDLVVYVPGESHSRTGALTTVPGSVLAHIVSAGAPVLPLFIDHPVETRLKIEQPRELEPLLFSFGKLLDREAITLANYRENLLAASCTAFDTRPALDRHLAYAVIQGLKRHGTTTRINDGLDHSELRFDKLLAAAAVFGKVIRKATAQPRVAIVLPPGRAGMLANIAALLAGKIPVNLNFTAGPEAINSAIAQAGVDRIITAERFMKKVDRFPWPSDDKIIFLERILPTLKPRIALWLAITKVLSAGAIARLLGIPRNGGDREAVLLFTSGSSGEPKGVPLSHRNIIANVNQFSSRLDLKLEDSVLACLPLFHSFGSTVTLWFPVIEGVNVVTYPSPLDAGKLAEVIEKYRASVVIATPTFLRSYLRRATKEQLASTKLIVTGAEKLPPALAEAFEKKFGKQVLEGYGLTETSPVTNVNLPDPSPDGVNPNLPALPDRRLGSVGQLIPGIALRITDPETDEPLPLHKSGMVWLRGANIFTGYLGKPEASAEVLQKGWFKTGDLGRMDEDGFLYIEGRLKRFSKIGGEMIPHETVEQAIEKLLELEEEDHRKIAVVGVPDQAKGEALVLLSTLENLDLTDLRYRLLEAGFASLWIPKTIIPVPEIPLLASGKLDLRGCEQAALSGTQ